MGYFNTHKNDEHLCISENKLSFAEVASNPNVTIAFYIKNFLSHALWPLWLLGLPPYKLTRLLQQRQGMAMVHGLLHFCSEMTWVISYSISLAKSSHMIIPNFKRDVESGELEINGQYH